MSSPDSGNISVVKISVDKTLEVCGQLTPPLDEDEKTSLVFELPRRSYFTTYCKMFKNNVSFALVKDEEVLGVIGAFWDLTTLPGPRHFIYTVIDPKVTSSASLLIAEVKKSIAGRGFSLRRVGFSFYPRLHDQNIYDAFRSQGFTSGPKDHRMKLDLPCEFQPRKMSESYSIEEVTKDTVYELLAVTRALTQSKPYPQAYQEVISEPDFATRPYDLNMSMGFLARCGEEPIGGMAINFVGEVACVMNVIVSPSHRRRAVAQNMLNESSSFAHQKGCRTMIVDSADNEAAI